MLGIILQKQHIWLAKNDQIIPKQRPYFIFCGDNFWVTVGSCRPFKKRTGRKIRNGVIVKKQSCSCVKARRALEWSTYWAVLRSEICPLRGQIWEPKLHPRGGFFGPWSFIILKNSHQDISNEGSNFILSSLEIGY